MYLLSTENIHFAINKQKYNLHYLCVLNILYNIWIRRNVLKYRHLFQQIFRNDLKKNVVFKIAD